MNRLKSPFLTEKEADFTASEGEREERRNNQKKENETARWPRIEVPAGLGRAAISNSSAEDYVEGHEVYPDGEQPESKR